MRRGSSIEAEAAKRRQHLAAVGVNGFGSIIREWPVEGAERAEL